MQHFEMVIGGKKRASKSQRRLETQNPFTSETWATVPQADASDVNDAVDSAHRSFVEGPWPRLTGKQRGVILHRVGDLVLKNIESLARWEIRDNGKTISEMRTQMQTMAQWYHYYAGLADKVHSSVIPVDPENYFNYTRYEPIGVVAAITPWNSPLRLLSWKIAPALAAGNTVVVKPSEFTSTSTLLFVDLLEEAGVPPGVVNVLTGYGSEIGPALVQHPLVAKISFTGGVDAGRKVYELAARHLKPVALELGGKSPNIIFEDADLDAAAAGAVGGIFSSTGQTCVAGSRLLVQETVLEQILEKLVRRGSGMRLGDPLDPATDIGPVATEQQFRKILSMIDTASSEGARLVLGGKRSHAPECGKGWFVEPTIYADVKNTMTISQQEVFGPVLSVIAFKDEEDAIRTANATNFGLAGGFWTKDVSRAHRVAARLQAGTVWINMYRKTDPAVPFGGYKTSGLGRESGIDAMKDFLQTKSVWLRLQ